MEKSKCGGSASPDTLKERRQKYLGRHLELSERRGLFSLEKQREKRVMRKAARMKHKAVRVRARLDELMFGTLIVRAAAVYSVNGIGHIVGTLLRPYATRGCDVIGL